MVKLEKLKEQREDYFMPYGRWMIHFNFSSNVEKPSLVIII